MNRGLVQGDADRTTSVKQSSTHDAASVLDATMLFTDHYAAVLARCRSVLHDVELAREAAQDTYVELRHCGARRPSLVIDLSFLLTMAVTTAQLVARREDSRKHAECCGVEVGDADTSLRPLARACNSELAAGLAHAIEELPPGQEAFLLDSLHGLSVRQMAVIHRVALSTVRTQLGRAHEHLRRTLSRFSGQPS